jgi:hypothetical protein
MIRFIWSSLAKSTQPDKANEPYQVNDQKYYLIVSQQKET